LAVVFKAETANRAYAFVLGESPAERAGPCQPLSWRRWKSRALLPKTLILASKVQVEVNTASASEVRLETERLFVSMFPAIETSFVPRAFDWAEEAFSGRFHDYQPIDARYHDFEHTLQGTLCLARLLHGRARARATPEFSERVCKLALLAILLHDTGYLKKIGDNEGTGAKYTLVHVQRSVEFAREFLAGRGWEDTDIVAVQHMIRCTGVNVNLSSIPFDGEEERLAGLALGTADLLGQMAAPDYIDKLPVLYREFEEAGHYGKLGFEFKSAQDLVKSTPGFWAGYVKPKINRDFEGLHHFLEAENGSNSYIDRIQANIDRLETELARSKAA
jgi:hypothetical protein